MAKSHASICYFYFMATDLSAYVRSITVRDSRDELDVSDMSAAGIKRIAGTPDWSVDVELYNDFADNLVNELLNTNLGVATALTFRPGSGNIGTGNPEYTGTGIFFENPIALAKKEVAMVSLTIKCSNGVALARATA